MAASDSLPEGAGRYGEPMEIDGRFAIDAPAAAIRPPPIGISTAYLPDSLAHADRSARHTLFRRAKAVLLVVRRLDAIHFYA